jgi:uncharacterized protein (UPF0262 family)
MPARSRSGSIARMAGKDPGCRLVSVELVAEGPPARGFIETERLVAIRDLIAENSFHPVGCKDRQLHLRLAVRDNRLILEIADAKSAPLVRHILSLSPLARILREYLQVCDSYNAAVGAMSPREVEAIDMGRRGLHNEGAETLRDRLEGKVEMDFATARRLFTLLCALRWRG